MSRWRIRCRRGCASISPAPPRPKASAWCVTALTCAWKGRSSPRYAESMTYKNLGYSVIGMTNMPEAKLAREAEICYATVAMVTDYDCWHPDHDAVTVQDIIKVLMANADKAKRLVARLAKDFPREHEPCPIGSDRALDTALITDPKARDKKLVKKLDAVAGRVLGVNFGRVGVKLALCRRFQGLSWPDRRGGRGDCARWRPTTPSFRTAMRMTRRSRRRCRPRCSGSASRGTGAGRCAFSATTPASPPRRICGRRSRPRSTAPAS